MEIGKTIDEISIGDKARFSKTIAETDIYLYAGLCGDFNPLHIDEEYAKKTMFKHRIAHGPIAIGLLATVLGTRLPGLGTLARELSVKFTAPVFIGDTITAEVEIIKKIVDRNIVHLKLTCRNQSGKEVLQGFGVMMPPLEKFREI